MIEAAIGTLTLVALLVLLTAAISEALILFAPHGYSFFRRTLEEFVGNENAESILSHPMLRRRNALTPILNSAPPRVISVLLLQKAIGNPPHELRRLSLPTLRQRVEKADSQELRSILLAMLDAGPSDSSKSASAYESLVDALSVWLSDRINLVHRRREGIRYLLVASLAIILTFIFNGNVITTYQQIHERSVVRDAVMTAALRPLTAESSSAQASTRSIHSAVEEARSGMRIAEIDFGNPWPVRIAQSILGLLFSACVVFTATIACLSGLERLLSHRPRKGSKIVSVPHESPTLDELVTTLRAGRLAPSDSSHTASAAEEWELVQDEVRRQSRRTESAILNQLDQVESYKDLSVRQMLDLRKNLAELEMKLKNELIQSITSQLETVSKASVEQVREIRKEVNGAAERARNALQPEIERVRTEVTSVAASTPGAVISELVKKLPAILRRPTVDLQRYNGFFCMRFSNGETALPLDRNGLAAGSGGVSYGVQFWFQDTEPKGVAWEPVRISEGEEAKQVQFEVVVYSDALALEWKTFAFAVPNSGKSDTKEYASTYKPSVGRHIVIGRVSQKGRLIQVVRCVLMITEAEASKEGEQQAKELA
jgi:hypothetical protein